MALNFDPTKKIKPPTSSVKIFEEPKETKPSSPPPIEPEQKKVEPKLSQTEVKVKPNPQPNLVQSEAKVEPIVSQRKEALRKVEPKPEPNHEPKLSQSRVKVEPKAVFEELVGLQRNVLINFFEMCVRGGSRITPPVAISNLAFALETTVSAGRKAIQRLEEKGFILRASFKDGRGGWTKYELKEEVYKTLLLSQTSAKVEPIISQSRVKVGTQVEPKPEPNVPYSNSSSLKENNNKEPEIADFQIPENLRALGVGQKPLAVLVRDNFLTHEEVQASLNHYSHDIAKNLAKVKSANFLFGCMRNKTPYISSSYAESETRAITQEIARIKQIQAEREELKELKLKEEYEQFLIQNPDFLEGLKQENQFLAKSPQGLLERMGFEKWREKFNT